MKFDDESILMEPLFVTCARLHKKLEDRSAMRATETTLFRLPDGERFTVSIALEKKGGKE